MESLVDKTLTIVATIALGLHVVFLFIAVYRAWRGKNSFDRLIGIDLTGILILCMLVLVAIINVPDVTTGGFNINSLYIDIALGLAALSYLSTIALAKYIVDHRMF